MTAQSADERVVFAASPADLNEDGIPRVVFLIPEAAWRYMHDGHAHDFDLTSVGIPVKIVIGRCKDRADAMRIVSHAKGIQRVALDTDFSIHDEKKKPS